MYADVGDWLIVKSHTEHRPIRRAEILAVRAGGQPPYNVRWTEDGHESLVFPGPDGEVITPAQQADQNRIQAERIDRIQAQIVTDHESHSG